MELNERIERFDPGKDLVFNILGLTEQIKLRLKDFLSQSQTGLGMGHWEALNSLWVRDGLTQAELARAIYRDAPFTTRLVDDLEKRSLVLRRQDSEDRRINRIYLSSRARTLKYQLLPAYFQMLDELSENLGPDAADRIRDWKASLSVSVSRER